MVTYLPKYLHTILTRLLAVNITIREKLDEKSEYVIEIKEFSIAAPA